MGPSAIGRNEAYLTKIFPTNSLPLLSVVANLGLVLYLFIVGMELGQSSAAVNLSCVYETVSDSATARAHQFLYKTWSKFIMICRSKITGNSCKESWGYRILRNGNSFCTRNWNQSNYVWHFTGYLKWLARDFVIWYGAASILHTSHYDLIYTASEKRSEVCECQFHKFLRVHWNRDVDHSISSACENTEGRRTDLHHSRCARQSLIVDCDYMRMCHLPLFEGISDHFLFLALDWSFPLSFPWFPGSMAMGAAALNDAAAWCLLVLAISLGINSVQHSNAKQKIYFYSCYRIILNVYLSWHVAANSANLNTAGFVFLSVVAFAVVLIVAFRPLWWQLVTYVENQNSPSMSNGLFCLTLILVFLCAWTTALIGLGERVSCSLFYSVTYCMDIVNSFFILPPSLIVYMSI